MNIKTDQLPKKAIISGLCNNAPPSTSRTSKNCPIIYWSESLQKVLIALDTSVAENTCTIICSINSQTRYNMLLKAAAPIQEKTWRNGRRPLYHANNFEERRSDKFMKFVTAIYGQ